MPSTVTLKREGSFGFELRRGTFNVLLDGKTVGMVEYNQTAQLEVEPGHHTIELRKGRYSSRSRAFDIKDGENATFQVHGAMLWPRYVASIVKPDLAIAVKPR